MSNLDFLNPDPPPIGVDIVNVPGSVATIATKINDAGQIVGVWIDSQDRQHGFLLIGAQYSSIDVPGAIATEALGLDNKTNLTITGDYVDSEGSVHGFTLTAGRFKRIDVPQASATTVTGINAINDSGHVVGSVLFPAVPLRPDISLGFLFGSGTFFPQEVFGFPTVLNDVNDLDFIAGGFTIGSALSPGTGSTPMVLVPLSAFPSGALAPQMIQLSLPPGALAKH